MAKPNLEEVYQQNSPIPTGMFLSPVSNIKN